jgi:hypothetical protein
MATILNEQAQYVDASGKPLVGGSVYIGDVGADPVLNPKAIFSDRAMTSALANPQTLDANGRTANKIWTDGKYSLQVNDINGVQVFQDIDRGESAITIDILNDISDVITTPANNDTLIITRDEAQAKITFANLLGTVLLSFRGLTQAANKIPYFTSATTSGQLDFVDEDDMAGDSATALPSQQSVKAYVDSVKAYVDGQALGVGQTWQDVSASRTHSTSYQNTTGRPIEVAVGSNNLVSAIMQISTDNVNWVTVGRVASTASQTSAHFTVPHLSYYRSDNSFSIAFWSELR